MGCTSILRAGTFRDEEGRGPPLVGFEGVDEPANCQSSELICPGLAYWWRHHLWPSCLSILAGYRTAIERGRLSNCQHQLVHMLRTHLTAPWRVIHCARDSKTLKPFRKRTRPIGSERDVPVAITLRDAEEAHPPCAWLECSALSMREPWRASFGFVSCCNI